MTTFFFSFFWFNDFLGFKAAPGQFRFQQQQVYVSKKKGRNNRTSLSIHSDKILQGAVDEAIVLTPEYLNIDGNWHKHNSS